MPVHLPPLPLTHPPPPGVFPPQEAVASPSPPPPPGVFPPQEAVDFAAHELWVKGNDVKQTCNRLVYAAIRERGCRDNCTVLLLRFDR